MLNKAPKISKLRVSTRSEEVANGRLAAELKFSMINYSEVI